MENDNRLRVAITQGDTNGIGFEVIFKTFADPEMFDLCTPIVYGSPKVASYHKNAINAEVAFSTIAAADEAQPGRLNLLAVSNEEIKVALGEPSAEAGKAAITALDRALADWQAGLVDVLVTAPINKASIAALEGMEHFCGHTEYIEQATGNGQRSLMILMNDTLRVALVTTHLAVKDIATASTKEGIVAKSTILNTALNRDFRVSAPRIAVLALNPHCGDNGLLGTEEQDIIVPAIKELNDAGVYAFGPYAADGFFGAANYTAFDGVLAMYHDQGLAPFKGLDTGTGINYTAGLPIVRTSPDHGTAYEIAGKGMAAEQSMREAIYYALDIFRNRKHYDEPTANPLPKLYHEKREDGDRPRYQSPKKQFPREKPLTGER